MFPWRESRPSDSQPLTTSKSCSRVPLLYNPVEELEKQEITLHPPEDATLLSLPDQLDSKAFKHKLDGINGLSLLLESTDDLPALVA